jgi:hypothetical protein
MASPQTIVRDGSGTQSVSYSLPPGVWQYVEAVFVQIDNSFGGDIRPTLAIETVNGVVMAKKRQAETIPAGDTGTATWALRLDDEIGAPSPLVTLRNLGVLGYSGSGTQATTYQHILQFQDVLTGDRIMVLAMAPSKPSALAPVGIPVSVADTHGNTYTQIADRLFEANPPNVNEGVAVGVFISEPLDEPMPKGVTAVTATWSNPVFDRSVAAWLVRHVPATHEPVWIAATNSNDAAVYASTQMTKRIPAYTPVRDNALYVAFLISAKVGGTGSFSSVAGFDGFFQDTVYGFTGSKQSYRLNQQTYGADATFIFDGLDPRYEVDLGVLPGGVFIFSFNGVGQNYSLGANAWKGILVFAID